MIALEKAEVWGWEHAIRGMRNPMNSWERSDSEYVPNIKIGENDRKLMTQLIRAGATHRKFLRQIFVSVDITAPLYWWKEFDTYKVGTTANSCSTMHKIHAKEFTIDDFSHEHLINEYGNTDEDWKSEWLEHLYITVERLNYARQQFIDSNEKKYWQQIIQLLPSSYNQKRTVTMTYENLLGMLNTRRNHKLDEWRKFCDWILELPDADLLKEGLTHEQG